MSTENSGPHIRHWRVLRRSRQIKTLDDTVAINVTEEVFWINGTDVRNAVRSIVVKGKITELDKAYQVEWKWAVDNSLKQALPVAIEAIGDIDGRFENTVVERETWIDANEWLRVGLMFTGNTFSHAYIEFTKGDKKLRAKLESTAELEEFGSMIYS